jgi:indolepyruvate ferredoxin oxidoreductase beta subunit
MAPKTEDAKRSGWRILIAGTGGQGALTAARVLSEFMIEKGHDIVSGQLHGMSQRAGSVQSSVMIDCGISPVMASGTADCLLGLEPVEAVRALPFLSARTVVFMNTAVVVPFVLGQRFARKEGDADYPDVGRLIAHLRAVTDHVFPLDATDLALQSGSIRAINTVMLGCLFGSGILPHTSEEFWSAASGKMPPAWAKANTSAFQSGVTIGRESRRAGAPR